MALVLGWPTAGACAGDTAGGDGAGGGCAEVLGEGEVWAWAGAVVAAAGERVTRVSDIEFVAPIRRGTSGKVFLVRNRFEKGSGYYALIHAEEAGF